MESVQNALQAMGKASSIEIAARIGIHRDQVVNELWDLKRAGVVVQKNKSWMLTTEDKSPADDSGSSAQMDMPSFLNTIPKFTAPRPDDLIIPTARGISREIRRTQHKLAQLEKLRDAVRQISRHKKLVQELVG